MMSSIIILLLLFQTVYSDIFDFSGFGPCTLKLKRFDDEQRWIDTSEQILHSNLGPTSELIYSIMNSSNSYGKLQISDPGTDFDFYESCSLSVFIGYNSYMGLR